MTRHYEVDRIAPPLECRLRAYTSKRDAKMAHVKAPFRVTVYRCPTCGAWHVANPERR